MLSSRDPGRNSLVATQLGQPVFHLLHTCPCYIIFGLLHALLARWRLRRFLVLPRPMLRGVLPAAAMLRRAPLPPTQWPPQAWRLGVGKPARRARPLREAQSVRLDFLQSAAAWAVGQCVTSPVPSQARSHSCRALPQFCLGQ